MSFLFRIFVFLFLSHSVLRIELDCFTVYKLLNVLFCQSRLLEIEIEWPHTHWFFIYIMQRRQIWVAQRLINYTQKKLVQKKTKTEKKQIYKYNSPVMRLLGSKTSIFSSKSTAPADMFGNLAAKFCLGYCGSCLTYLLALSLLKNPKLESSGDPISCFSKIHQQMQMIPKRNTKQRFYG